MAICRQLSYVFVLGASAAFGCAVGQSSDKGDEAPGTSSGGSTPSSAGNGPGIGQAGSLSIDVGTAGMAPTGGT